MSLEPIKPPRPQNVNSLEEQATKFDELVKLLRTRSSWDAKQTSESIASLSIEEVYEMIEAIHSKNDEELKKELGDLMLHIYMQAMFAEERGAFKIADVFDSISNKLISRLPSVFSSEPVSDEKELMKKWEQLKQKEGRDSALSDVPKSVPALLRAERLQIKASRVGFDWDNKSDVWKKVDEELSELKEALNESQERKEEEFGDFLFSLVNIARYENIVPEEALMKANNKFLNRFRYIESKAKEQNLDIKNMSLDQMDKLWNQAKLKGIK
ncbi:nucleoside triphosphate pyrophosphohydrolase [Candidatus Kapabacteria bacterium]|nr:nucleoside triphosphate pyrophosphohydrolase [Candidatus Kapabacteria bacterium]